MTKNSSESTNNEKCVLVELNVGDDNLSCSSPIEQALSEAEAELTSLNETIDTIATLKTKCDKLDYTLAASVGAICGIIDVFLIAKPGESLLGDKTDDWFNNRTKSFAKLNGWKGGDDKSAIRFLEKKFKVPYDQRGAGDAGAAVFDMTPKNHHFKSLAHNPSLLGLFFSILDQFTNSSHFVSINPYGDLIELVEADNELSLRGKTLPAKIICGTFNWIGHMISDISGSSSGVGRGSGIPSPLWTWINDVLAIKAKLKIPRFIFEEDFYNIALELFKKGYDFRFQTAQAIPVLFNELTVRLLFSIRRYLRFRKEQSDYSFKDVWEACKPFGSPEIKRMLTVAHGTFCVIEITDATIRGFAAGGGAFNPVEFFLRLNVIGLGRFTISLGGEVKRYSKAKKASQFAQREKPIVEDYIEGLQVLSFVYSDDDFSSLTKQISSISTAEEVLLQTATIAEKRGGKGLKNIEDIRNYFKPQ